MVEVSDSRFSILLVEDNPADVMFTMEAFSQLEITNPLEVAEDGDEALRILGLRRDNAPGLILLDLNLPKRSGREVLAEIKADERLKSIPVIVLSTSKDPKDVYMAYSGNANCYITKPRDLYNFIEVVSEIKKFWLNVALLPEYQ